MRKPHLLGLHRLTEGRASPLREFSMGAGQTGPPLYRSFIVEPQSFTGWTQAFFCCLLTHAGPSWLKAWGFCCTWRPYRCGLREQWQKNSFLGPNCLSTPSPPRPSQGLPRPPGASQTFQAGSACARCQKVHTNSNESIMTHRTAAERSAAHSKDTSASQDDRTASSRGDRAAETYARCPKAQTATLPRATGRSFFYGLAQHALGKKTRRV